MADVPTTSTTLLRDIARDSAHVRWNEFVARYRPMMEAFMRERFPSVEADDVMQETLVALCKVLPDYRYSPDDRGAFLSENDGDFIAGGYTNWYARVYGEAQLRQEELCRQRATRAVSEASRISALRNGGKTVKEDDYVWLEGELKNIVEQLGRFNERWSEIRKRYASSRSILERAAAETKPITIQLMEMWEREIRSCLDAR